MVEMVEMEEMEIVHPDKVKDMLISKTAVRTMMPERIVEKIVQFQFQDVKDNMLTKSQLFIYRLGAFKLTPRRVQRRLMRLLNLCTKYEAQINAPGTKPKIRETAEARYKMIMDQVKILQEIHEVRL